MKIKSIITQSERNVKIKKQINDQYAMIRWIYTLQYSKILSAMIVRAIDAVFELYLTHEVPQVVDFRTGRFSNGALLKF